MSGPSLFATSLAAWEAAKLLAGYRHRCGGASGSFSGYATGGMCAYKSANRRAEFSIKIRARIEQLMRSDEIARER